MGGDLRICERRNGRALGDQDGRQTRGSRPNDGWDQTNPRGADAGEGFGLPLEQTLGRKEGGNANRDSGHVDPVANDHAGVRAGVARCVAVLAGQAAITGGVVVGDEVTTRAKAKNGVVAPAVDPSVDARHGDLPGRPSEWRKKPTLRTGVPEPS
jgi:hypothetical protein